MIPNFRTYDLAIAFYKTTSHLSLPSHLKEQLSRAASSIVLNLAEGRGRIMKGDQRRFFRIAFGSLRECQAIFDISENATPSLLESADILAAHLYKLIKAL